MAKKLLETLGKLVKLHEGLLTVTEDKGEALIENNADRLQQLVQKEQTYVAAIHTVEQQRLEQASSLLQNVGKQPEEEAPTISECMEVLADAQLIQQFEQRKDELIMIVAALTQQNKLNRELAFQSLQFVNMTMEMIMPKKNTMNYSNNKSAANLTRPNRSMFDSRT